MDKEFLLTIGLALGILFIIVLCVLVLVTFPALLIWLAVFVIITFALVLILKAVFSRQSWQTV